MSSKAWDFTVTRRCMYPQYYILHKPGKKGKICSLYKTSHELKVKVTEAFLENQFSKVSTYFPIGDRDVSIVRDLPLIGEHYPAYRDYILLTLYNGETAHKVQDHSNQKDGPWYGVLGMITWTHASALARNNLPRAVFNPGTDVNDATFHQNCYPTWDWESVNQKLIGDIICVHYMDWYYDFCQPNLEKQAKYFGKFFTALEMLLDYVTHLVNEKKRCILDCYESDKEHNNTTPHAFHALNQHRDNEHSKMMIRFLGHEWNMERYDPTHQDNS
jgi:hypothetical protein